MRGARPMLREWKAERYHELSDPQFAWSKRVLEFGAIRCWLEETPVTFSDAGGLRAFLETVVMRHFLAALRTPTLRDGLLDVMTEGAMRDSRPLTLDYWRLDIDATHP